MCQVFPSYQFLALYVVFMAKHIEDEDVLYIFKHWYETGEIDYNKEILGSTPYLIAVRHMEHPITALLEEYAIKTGQIPFPAYLKIENIHNYLKTMNFGVRNKKPSEDGFHLIACSEYDYNEVSGNHWANLSYEELAEEDEKIHKRIMEKLRNEGQNIW